MNQQLFYFILGILCIELFIPTIEALAIVVVTFLEMCKGKVNLTISKYNVQIQKLADDLEPTKNPIGFVTTKETKEEEEELE